MIALDSPPRRVASIHCARRDEHPRCALRDLSTGRWKHKLICQNEPEEVMSNGRLRRGLTNTGSDPCLISRAGWQFHAVPLEIFRLDIGVVAAELVFELPRAGRRWRCTVSQAFRQSQSVVNHNQACVGYLPRFVSQH